MEEEREKERIPIINEITFEEGKPRCIDIRNLLKFKYFKGRNIEFISDLNNHKYLASNFKTTDLSIHDKYTPYDRHFEDTIVSVLFKKKGEGKIRLVIRTEDDKKYTFTMKCEKGEIVKFYKNKNYQIKRLRLIWEDVQIVKDLMEVIVIKREINNFYINLIMEDN